METIVPKKNADTGIPQEYKKDKWLFRYWLGKLPADQRPDVAQSMPRTVGVSKTTWENKLYAKSGSEETCTIDIMMRFANEMTVQLKQVITVNDLINNEE